MAIEAHVDHHGGGKRAPRPSAPRGLRPTAVRRAAGAGARDEARGDEVALAAVPVDGRRPVQIRWLTPRAARPSAARLTPAAEPPRPRAPGGPRRGTPAGRRARP